MPDPIVTLDVEKPTAGGRMLARHNGQIVLVWGAIPGERVRARIERRGKGVLFAETIEVLSASPDRREVVGDWRCGGNVLAHANYSRQLELKSAIVSDAFARIARMPLAAPPSIVPSPEEGYRMRARLHAKEGRIGFVREGSHTVCDAGPTGQLLAATVQWLDFAAACIREKKLSGLVSLEIAENIAATERACHLELEAGSASDAFAILVNGALTGLSAQVLDRRGVHTLSGDPCVTDTLGTLRLRRDARAFFQGNRFLLESLVQRVTALVPDGQVVDLYAGVGLFGLSLAAARGVHVSLVEGDPISGHDLEENAGPYADRVRVVRASVEDFLGEWQPLPDSTFIVDPPRTGMSVEAVTQIVRAKPRRVVYVSCDVATLARDARLLVNGDYLLADITAVDLFPNTAHVETVCVFDRHIGG